MDLQSPKCQQGAKEICTLSSVRSVKQTYKNYLSFEGPVELNMNVLVNCRFFFLLYSPTVNTTLFAGNIFKREETAIIIPFVLTVFCNLFKDYHKNTHRVKKMSYIMIDHLFSRGGNILDAYF